MMDALVSQPIILGRTIEAGAKQRFSGPFPVLAGADVA